MFVSAVLLFGLLDSAKMSVGDLDLGGMTQGWGEARRDLTVDAKPITIGGIGYAHGLGTHAESDFLIDLFGGAESFQAMVGVPDEVGTRGSVEFEVWVDGKRVATSGVMRGGQPAKPIQVALRSAKRLRLHVTDGGDDMNYDHAVWADAFIRYDRNHKAPRAFVPPPEPVPVLVGIETKKPQFHGPRVVGMSPDKPFVWRVPATGAGKVAITLRGLPQGLRATADGVVSGVPALPGEYKVQATATNKLGRDQRTIIFTVGKGKIARTPPMGWNSWYAWGLDVDQKDLIKATKAMIDTGLAGYGYQYVNLDDGWEAEKRLDNGEIVPNKKFPDIQGMVDQIHDNGLKFGIYSSPGPRTCGGYLGSFQHEMQDAQTYAKWGVDLLKYDWCSYGDIAKNPDLPAMKKPYALMGSCIEQLPRDMVMSMCQYGMGNVWEWGGSVGGNLWRTTGDNFDTWNVMSKIGFGHVGLSKYAKPGQWNDPDMLMVGRLGISRNNHPTRLTKNEQMTQMTLWCMLAAPLLISCDLWAIDDWTKRLLMNHEAIEIDQDSLGRGADRVLKDGDFEVWTRPLADGSMAVALFNRGNDPITRPFAWSSAKAPTRPRRVLDVWTGSASGAGGRSMRVSIPRHGAKLFRLWK